jgi:hypothetical protein
MLLILSSSFSLKGDLPPEFWSISNVIFLIKSSIRKGFRDEEEVHGGLDHFCSAAGGKRDAGGGDHWKFALFHANNANRGNGTNRLYLA